jgi:CRP-like cAMP-binding protein
MKELDLDPQDEKLLAQFRRIEIFHGLNRQHLTEIFNLSRLRSYENGEAIIREGTFDHRVFFLLSGQVSVQRDGVEISHLRRLGDIFGEMGVIDGSPRSATIVASGQCTVLALDFSFTDRLSEGDRVLALALLYRVFAEVLADRLRRADARIAKLEQELLRKQTPVARPATFPKA